MHLSEERGYPFVTVIHKHPGSALSSHRIGHGFGPLRVRATRFNMKLLLTIHRVPGSGMHHDASYIACDILIHLRVLTRNWTREFYYIQYHIYYISMIHLYCSMGNINANSHYNRQWNMIIVIIIPDTNDIIICRIVQKWNLSHKRIKNFKILFYKIWFYKNMILIIPIYMKATL